MSRSFRLRLLSLEDGRLRESAYTHSSKSDSGSRSEEVGGKHGLRVDGGLGGGRRGGGGKRGRSKRSQIPMGLFALSLWTFVNSSPRPSSQLDFL